MAKSEFYYTIGLRSPKSQREANSKDRRDKWRELKAMWPTGQPNKFSTRSAAEEIFRYLDLSNEEFCVSEAIDTKGFFDGYLD